MGEGKVGVALVRTSMKYGYPRDSAALAKYFLETAEAFILAQRGKVQIPPCFMFFTEGDQFVMDASEFMDSGGSKDILVQVAKVVAKDLRAIACVFLSEVWLTVYGREDGERLNPDRQECLLVSGEYIGMPGCVALSQIIRDSSGAAISFKPNLVSGSAFEGRFSGILG